MRLARHDISARYPDGHAGGTALERYRPSDSAQALADAEAAHAFVDEAWSAIEQAADER